MAAYTASDVFGLVGWQLHDVGHVTWPESLLYIYLSEAQNQIALLKPSCTAQTEAFPLLQSPKQVLPTDGMRLLDIIRNLGVDGAVPGDPIRKISRKVLDGYNPSWPTETTATGITHFIFEPESPMTFWVYPVPSVATLQVELSYSKAPAKITSLEAGLSVPDIYIAPILEWILYRCLSMEVEGASVQLALQHKNEFYMSLGTKTKADEISEKDMNS